MNKLRRGRYTLWLHGLSLSELSIPRPIWFFEGSIVEVGLDWGTQGGDPLIGFALAIDLPGWLADALYHGGQRVGVWSE